MSKKPLNPTAPAESPELLPAVAERMTSGQELTAATNKAVAALARQLNYQGSIDPAALENSARDTLRRLGTTIFELGGYLLLLKEACPHGQFLPALERLGLGVSAAGRYMAVTRRFANSASTRNLEAAGIGKLAELLPLDDTQLDELTELGETGELSLEDVDRMSLMELRDAVRKVRCEKKRLEDVNAELHQEVVQHKVKGKVVALTDWPAALEVVSDQVAAAGRKLATALSELETCRITIFEHANALGDDQRPAFEAALAHVAEVYQDALDAAERKVGRERTTFDKTLGAFGAEGAL